MCRDVIVFNVISKHKQNAENAQNWIWDVIRVSSRYTYNWTPNPVQKMGVKRLNCLPSSIMVIVGNYLTNLKTYLNPDLTGFLSLIINLGRLTTHLLRLPSSPTPRRIYWCIPNGLISGRKTLPRKRPWNQDPNAAAVVNTAWGELR